MCTQLKPDEFSLNQLSGQVMSGKEVLKRLGFNEDRCQIKVDVEGNLIITEGERKSVYKCYLWDRIGHLSEAS